MSCLALALLLGVHSRHARGEVACVGVAHICCVVLSNNGQYAGAGGGAAAREARRFRVLRGLRGLAAPRGAAARRAAGQRGVGAGGPRAAGRGARSRGQDEGRTVCTYLLPKSATGCLISCPIRGDNGYCEDVAQRNSAVACKALAREGLLCRPTGNRLHVSTILVPTAG